MPSESTSSICTSPFALEEMIKSAKVKVEDSSSMVRLLVGVRQAGVPARVLCEVEAPAVGVNFNLFREKHKLGHEYIYLLIKRFKNLVV